MAKVAGTFVPTDANVPIVDAKYIKGGLQVAANEAARLALPVAMLSVGTHVFQDDTDETWRVSAINGETVTWEDATPSAGASIPTEVFSVVQTANAGVVSAAVELGTQVTDAGVGIVWAAGMLRAVGSGGTRGAIYQIDSEGNSVLLHAHNMNSLGAQTFERWIVGQYNRVDLIQVASGTVTPNTIMYQNSLRIWRALGAGGAVTVESSLLALESTMSNVEAKTDSLGAVTASGEDAAAARAVIEAVSLEEAQELLPTVYVCIASANSAALASAAVTIGSAINTQTTGTVWTAGQLRYVVGTPAAGSVYTLQSNGTWTLTFDAAAAGDFNNLYTIATGTQVGTRAYVKKNGTVSTAYTGLNVTNIYGTGISSSAPITLSSMLGSLSGVSTNTKASIASMLSELKFPFAAATWYGAAFSSTGSWNGTVTLGDPIPGTCGAVYAEGTLGASLAFTGTMGNIYTLQANGTWLLTDEWTTNGYRWLLIPDAMPASEFNGFSGLLLLKKEGSSREICFAWKGETPIRTVVGAVNGYSTTPNAIGDLSTLPTTAKTILGSLTELFNRTFVSTINTRSGAVTLTGADVGLGAVTATGATAAAARSVIGAATEDQAYAAFSYESAIQVSQVGSTDTVSANVTIGAQIPSAPNGTTWQIGSRRFADTGAQAGAVYIVGSGGVCTIEHQANVDAGGRVEFFRWVQDLAGYTLLVARRNGSLKITYVGARNAEAHYFTDTGDGFRSTVSSKLLSIGKLANLVQSVKTSIVDALNELFGLTRKIPIDSVSTAYAFVNTDGGRMKMHPTADTTARVWTIPANASVPIDVGTVITILNQNGAGALTIAITTDTLRQVGTTNTGSRTVAANGMVTLTKTTATEWYISGGGLT